jgi:hypothetical protein
MAYFLLPRGQKEIFRAMENGDASAVNAFQFSQKFGPVSYAGCIIY